MKPALSIAGSDPSGGAGIQADIKTFAALGVYAAAVPAALTVQDTRGVREARAVDSALVRAQAAAILEDMDLGAAKAGMLMSVDNIEAVAELFAARPRLPLVVDTVLVSSSGAPLAEAGAEDAYLGRLIPVAALVTPNLDEAVRLLGCSPIQDRAGMLEAAKAFQRLGARSVLLKGGHLPGPECPDLLLLEDGQAHWLEARRVDSAHTHGTGCALSAAIAAHLALGKDMLSACGLAKEWLVQALEAGKSRKPGQGRGSPHHFWKFDH